MKITYNNILIRNAETSDAMQLCEWWNDGRVMAHAGFPKGLNTTADRIKKQIESNSEFCRNLIIEFAGLPIGEMNYRHLEEGKVEIGIKICNAQYQNRGLGRIVLSLLIKELFFRGYKTIVLDTNLNNQRARHVYELLGFTQVNILENSWTNQLGELQSTVNYELIAANFRDFSGKTSHPSDDELKAISDQLIKRNAKVYEELAK